MSKSNQQKSSRKPSYFFGIHATYAMLKHRPEDVLELFVLSERAQKDNVRIRGIIGLAEQFGIAIQHAQKSKLDSLARSTQHQGVVAHARALKALNEHDIEPIFERLPSNQNALFLVLDQVSDPHNLGAIMRTAAAMNVTAVITTKDNAASLTPTATKVAAGGAELVSFVQVTNLVRTLKALKSLGCFVVGTALDAAARPLHQVDLNQHLTIIMGAEEKGLRRLTLKNCDALVFLPMLGDIQSLNVSVATGMALYEAISQRSKADI